MTPAQGDPLYNCNACGMVLVAPHYSAKDCPAYGQGEGGPVVMVADGDTAEIFLWMTRRGWTDDGLDGPGKYEPVVDALPSTHFFGDPCRVGLT